jgi:hypothetical protein
MFGPATKAKLKAHAPAEGAEEVSKELFEKLTGEAPAPLGPEPPPEGESDEPGESDTSEPGETGDRGEGELVAAAEDELTNYGIDKARVQKIWDKYVLKRGKLRTAQKDPTLAFIKGVEGSLREGGTDEGLLFAALYWAGGYNGIDTNSRLYKRKVGNKSAKAAAHSELSGKAQKFADWLGKADRKKVLNTDGSFK